MRESEAKEFMALLESLEEAGWHPMLCDTPIPFYDNEVMCGIPNSVGDVVKEVRMLPKELLAMQPEFLVRARGDSMKDAGIMEGDILQVVTDVPPSDGDIVLATLDGDYTVKTYCEDDEGRPWLVPQNEEYSPIRLEDYNDVVIVGVVRQVTKRVRHVSHNLCMKILNKAKREMESQKVITDEQVSNAIGVMAEKIEISRLWFAVYRTMVDEKVWKDGDFKGFCDRVRAEVPEHEHLPVAEDLQRMDVGSFSKSVVLWNEKDAPVQGKRFKRYVEIAQMTDDLLWEE